MGTAWKWVWMYEVGGRKLGYLHPMETGLSGTFILTETEERGLARRRPSDRRGLPGARYAAGNPRRSDGRRRALVLDGVPRLGRRRRVRLHHSAEASAPGTTGITRSCAGLVRRLALALHSGARKPFHNTDRYHSPSSALDDEEEWEGRGRCRDRTVDRLSGRRTNRSVCVRLQGSRHQRHGAAPGPPPADLLPSRHPRRPGSDPLPVLSQYGDDLERAGDPGGADLLRLSSDDRRLHRVSQGGD